ncbi:MAG TPA: hypothetical protein PLU24_05910, partial [Candidatus Omnitrophota bacterium]|nr:hypothetical protein [Candidatus Omnitrophota bacterium]
IREVKAKGIYEQAQRYWLKFTMPTLIEEELKTKARLIAPQAVLRSHEIRNVADLDKEVYLGFTFEAPQYLKKAGTTRIMDQLGGVESAGVFKEKRRYPIETSALSEQEETIEVELPQHLAVKYLPKPVEFKSKWFDFINTYSMADKKTIRFYSLMRVNERSVSIQDYPEYKKALEEVAVLSDQQAIIEEKGQRRVDAGAKEK